MFWHFKLFGVQEVTHNGYGFVQVGNYYSSADNGSPIYK
jgi:hypothetical protein